MKVPYSWLKEYVDIDITAEELQEKLRGLKEELFNLRFQLAINQLENPMRISAVKKDIARVQTVLTELENSTEA